MKTVQSMQFQRLRSCHAGSALHLKSRKGFWPVLILLTTLGCQTSVDNVAEFPSQSSEESAKSQAIESNEVTLHATWKPFADSKYNFGEQWKTLRELKPAETDRVYTQKSLAVFLPPKSVSIGDTWKMEVAPVVSILKQLHEGATSRLRIGGTAGALACLAAENETHQLVRSRTHAQFVLADGNYNPSQFAGQALIDKSTSNVVALRLFVPPRRNNVDLNWFRKPAKGELWGDKEGNNIRPAKEVMIADIGYCSQLELVGGKQELFNSLKWPVELEYETVDEKFRKQLYEFAQINWLPFEQAVAMSESSGKPLHVVALFGVLDDESC